jgi:hypothetical protein
MAAWVFSAGLLATGVTVLYIGGGAHHIQKTTVKEITNLLKLFLAGQMLWAAANTAVKISVLDLYIQIFRNRRFRIVSYVMMAVSLGYLIMVILEGFLLCRPVSYTWNKLQIGKCGNERKVYLSSGIVNLIIDAAIVILPMPMLWGLQLGMAKKVALTVIFGLGALICVITILRLVELARFDLANLTYELSKVALWTGLEPMLGIINACLPVIQPVLKKVVESKIFSRSSRGAKSSKYWNSSSSKGRKSNPGDINSFHRLEDPAYPLRALRDGIGTQTQISGPANRSFSTSDDVEAQIDGIDLKSPRTTINVRRDWEVQVEPLGVSRTQKIG